MTLINLDRLCASAWSAVTLEMSCRSAKALPRHPESKQSRGTSQPTPMHQQHLPAWTQCDTFTISDPNVGMRRCECSHASSSNSKNSGSKEVLTVNMRNRLQAARMEGSPQGQAHETGCKFADVESAMKSLTRAWSHVGQRRIRAQNRHMERWLMAGRPAQQNHAQQT